MLIEGCSRFYPLSKTNRGKQLLDRREDGAIVEGCIMVMKAQFSSFHRSSVESRNGRCAYTEGVQNVFCNRVLHNKALLSAIELSSIQFSVIRLPEIE